MPMILTGEVGVGAGTAINTALQSSVNPSNFVTDFIAILPWVASLIGVVFVITKVTKLLKGSSKGKVRL